MLNDESILQKYLKVFTVSKHSMAKLFRMILKKKTIEIKRLWLKFKHFISKYETSED